MRRKNKMNKLFFCPDAGVEIQVFDYNCKKDKEPQASDG
jgi:hypothetical protein